MELKTYSKEILSSRTPKQMYKKSYVLKKSIKKISNLDILNKFLDRLKGCDFKIYSTNGFLNLEYNNKHFKVVV